MENDDPRDRLAALVAARGESLTALSTHLLRRGPGYLQQYVRAGSPRRLAEDDRRRLADHLGVDEAVLGAPARAAAGLSLPRLDVAASAGPGSTVDGEVLLGATQVPPELVRHLRLKAGEASVIRVRGTSMEPTLCDGDQIVVRTSDRVPGTGGGLFVVRIDGAVMVKRVTRHAGALVATSDNPAADPVPRGPVAVIGRVVWLMREPR